jgi:hypothetical protein
MGGRMQKSISLSEPGYTGYYNFFILLNGQLRLGQQINSTRHFFFFFSLLIVHFFKKEKKMCEIKRSRKIEYQHYIFVNLDIIIVKSLVF